MKTQTLCRAVLISIFCSVILNVSAQIPTVQWDKSFGGNDLDIPNDIISTNDGGYLISGYSASSKNGDKSSVFQGGFDHWIIKTDAFGNKQWDKSFGGSGQERAFNAFQRSDGSYLVGGFSGSGITNDKSEPSRGVEDFWLLKLDQNGNKLWDKAYGGNSSEYFKSMNPTSDGGFILGGWSESGISGEKSEVSRGNSDYWIVKIDSNGTKQWDRTFGGSSVEWFNNVQQTNDGGYIIGGSSADNSANSGDRTQTSRGRTDIWIVKTNSLGVKQWDKTFGGNKLDEVHSIIQTPDGGYLLGGYSYSDASGNKNAANLGDSDFWLIKIDSLGNKLWDKTFGGANYDAIQKIIKTKDGNYLLAGISASGISNTKLDANIGDNDFWLVKVDGNGNILWDKTIGGSLADNLSSVIEIASEEYLLAGYSMSDYSGDKTSFNKGVWDFWILKLGTPYYTRTISNISKPTNLSHLSIYPNPTYSETGINLQFSTNQIVTATLSNSLGQQIEKRILSPKNGSITENFSTNNLTKGIYFLAVFSNHTQIVKKIVVK
ncbi:T9SS type A sorting domain-containing protein [Adhaeribacter soli]|uniref:T9SS type A sorting domain-containing protein n=1 Tax=Adhaeribacter soli TaxID=2607655 RepID=A0A5N1J529_9BACT|nr:T9SS type A sorting domain-containing protein [Adhaeribacter soli]KAA9346016.1 T9SS type A sorting domain-containing protein [Adhaeribacter soli]